KAERILGGGGVFAAIDPGEIGAESGAALRLAVDKNKPAALFHNAVHGRETEASALGTLGGEERLEDARLGVVVHADAGVADGENDIVARGERRMCAGEVFVERGVRGLDG